MKNEGVKKGMSRPVIALDVRMARASGIGTYLQGLLPALHELRTDREEIALIQSTKEMNPCSARSATVTAGIYTLGEQVAIPNACRKLSARLLHSPHYNLPIVMASRCIVTVHDLIHLKFPQFLPSSLARAYARFFFKTIIPRTRAILTVSEHTKMDLMEMLDIPASHITVAYPGVPAQFHPQSTDSVDKTLKDFGLKRGYFLFVGNLKEFKNVQFLVKAYQALREKLSDCPSLVLVGRNFIPGFDKQLESMPSVRWLKEIEPNVLPSLYAGALGLVFPSLYEGFGFPPLEAMACGTPVICSTSASLPEVVGDAALLIDPRSLDSLLDAMITLQQDSALRDDLRSRGLKRAEQFSWKTLAEKTLSVYRQCLN